MRRFILYFSLPFLFFACQSVLKPPKKVQQRLAFKTAEGTTTIIDYYPNGQLKELKEQGKMGPFGVQTGVHYFFNPKGILTKQIRFKNEWPNQSSEMDILLTQEVCCYDATGKMTKSYVLQSSYEGTPTLVGKVKNYPIN